jgi:hypothetical protein
LVVSLVCDFGGKVGHTEATTYERNHFLEGGR